MIELIVRYTGDLRSLSEEIGFEVEVLLGGYAVITIAPEKAEQLLLAKEILWTEIPARVFLGVANGRRATGVSAVQASDPELTGKGVYVAIIDSGIDFRHPDFRKEDGTTRIEALWDQTAAGRETPEQPFSDGAQECNRAGRMLAGPPKGYRQGVLYTEEQINEALRGETGAGGEGLVPEQDIGGHGTHVAGIAAGNGRASQGRYRGVAYESTLLVVKLGGTQNAPFPQTTNVMTAVDFCVRYAAERGVPLALNLSFGNQEGAHDGSSFIETYLDDMALYGRNCICIGTGNDGAVGLHVGGTLRAGNETEELFLIGNGERRIRFGIWLSALDTVDIFLESPGGRREAIEAGKAGSGVAVKGYPIAGGAEVSFGTTVAEVFSGQATPYRQLRQIEVTLLGQDGKEIEPGIWRIVFRPVELLLGGYDSWIFAGKANERTGFLSPTPERTLTIPSTASRPIAVAAYNSVTNGTAPFSGRGFPGGNAGVKPDLAAPGVDIISCAPGGGYTTKSGTSMATPFVTGAGALLLQWGILRGNDPYLYGERLKSYLLYGAEPISGGFPYPNRYVGYGKVNLYRSLQRLRQDVSK